MTMGMPREHFTAVTEKPLIRARSTSLNRRFMSSKPEQGSMESERGLLVNKYVLVIALLLVIVFAINSWNLGRSQIAQGGDFSVTTLTGDNFSVSTSRGKVIVINFMATTCPYCRAEIPELKKLWNAYGGKIVLVSISVDTLTDTDGLLRDFASAYEADWIWARDVVGATIKYQVRGTPTTFILDEEGLVRYRHEGFTEASTLMNELDVLINS